MTPLRVAVADDEPLARRRVKQLLAGVPDVEVAVEIATGDELAAALGMTRVDVLVLDIRMPGRDVFDVLAESARAAPDTLPTVIFTTAYERYAVRAFELNAADYLVKPLAASRFQEALARARARFGDRVASVEAVNRVARDLGARPERVLVPERGRMVPIAVAAIDWIQAEGDYARIHSGGRSYLVSRSMNELARRLDADCFIRIHRSAIVNIDRIKEVRPEGSSRHSVVLTDGTCLILSRGRADQLKRWLV